MSTQAIINCPSIACGNSGQVLTVGNDTGSTNILGKLTLSGLAGTTGQVLTSAGSLLAPVWATAVSAWNGIATSVLNMGNFEITNCGGLTISGTNHITLGNGGTLPTSSQLGYLLPVGTANRVLVANIATNVYTVSVPAGVWMASANCRASTNSNFWVSISPVFKDYNLNSVAQLQPSPTLSAYLNCSLTISQTVATTWYMTAFSSSAFTFDVASFSFQIVRIG